MAQRNLRVPRGAPGVAAVACVALLASGCSSGSGGLHAAGGAARPAATTVATVCGQAVAVANGALADMASVDAGRLSAGKAATGLAARQAQLRGYARLSTDDVLPELLQDATDAVAAYRVAVMDRTTSRYTDVRAVARGALGGLVKRCSPGRPLP